MSEVPATVETNRVSLSAEDRALISTSMNELNQLKTQYGQQHLNFDQVRLQFEDHAKQHQAEAARLRGLIDAKYKDVQGVTSRLISSYAVDPVEGGWSLNVVDGCFVRVQSTTAPAPTTASAETSTTTASVEASAVPLQTHINRKKSKKYRK